MISVGLFPAYMKMHKDATTISKETDKKDKNNERGGKGRNQYLKVQRRMKMVNQLDVQKYTSTQVPLRSVFLANLTD